MHPSHFQLHRVNFKIFVMNNTDCSPLQISYYLLGINRFLGSTIGLFESKELLYHMTISN